MTGIPTAALIACANGVPALALATIAAAARLREIFTVVSLALVIGIAVLMSLIDSCVSRSIDDARSIRRRWR